nr:DUF2938 family protein [uncultured Moellerella sp.]
MLITPIEIISYILLLGIISTLFMDFIGVIQARLFRSPGLNYAFVGRWALSILLKGQFKHDPIMATPSIAGEKVLGWCLHYLIGIVFATLMVFYIINNNQVKPNFIAAIATGIISLIAPYFIMQPGFGFGIAASKLPTANKVRLKSFIAHLSYGLGLYLAMLILNFIY